MKPWIKVFLITVALAVPAMLLGSVIWPPAGEGAEPTAGQIPFFIVLSAVEAIALGLGVSFLLFGFGPLSRAVGGSGLKTWAMYLSLGWLLVSWWPHDHLHQHIGDDLQALLYIEYGFHVTLIICGTILAYSFLTMLRTGEPGSGTTTARVR